MARKGFLYYLFSKNKGALYIDDAGHVQETNPGNYVKPDGEPAHLEHSPEGWRDQLVKYERSLTYWGLVRSMAVTMKFPLDGAKILRNKMWAFGIQAVIYLNILKLDRTQLPYNYPSWYLSELNFVKYKQTKTAVFIEALEGGLSKLLKSNEGIVYEIPVSTDPEKVFVKLDGIELTKSANYFLINDISIDNTNYGDTSWAPLAVQNSEGRASGITFQDQSLENTAGTAYATRLLSNNCFAVASSDNLVPIDLVLKGKIVFKCTEQDAANGLRMRFLRSNQLIANQNDYVILLDTPLVENQVYSHDINLTIPLEPGERCYLEMFFGNTGVDTKFEFLSDSTIKIQYQSRYRTTYAEGLYPYRVAQLLVDQMTNGQYTIKSDWLKAKKDIILCSGNDIRGIRYIDTLVPNKISTSLTSFFKSFNRWMIGLTIENDKLVIEPRTAFFNNTIITDIGSIDEPDVVPAEDLLFNSIKVGGKEIEYDDVNGIYEPNQGQEWLTPLNKYTKELDLISDYRMDPIGIELLRMNYENLSTTDTKNDKDVFMLNVKTVAEIYTTKVDFFSGGVYMTNPSNIPAGYGMIMKITGSTSNDGTRMVVATGVNIIQFDPAGLAVVDETGADITVEFITGGTFALNRPAYTSTEGLLPGMDTSIFNLELSPKRALINNGPFIRAILDLQDWDVIKRTSVDKNGNLVTTFAGVTIDEKKDIQIGSLGTPLFRPYYISFKTKVPINLLELINANQYGKIKFSYLGNTFYGFLMSGGLKPGTLDEQTWKLLSAYENDLSKI